jgi:hypothetical protein
MNDEEEGIALSISVGGTSNNQKVHIYTVTLIILAHVSWALRLVNQILELSPIVSGFSLMDDFCMEV